MTSKFNIKTKQDALEKLVENEKLDNNWKVAASSYKLILNNPSSIEVLNSKKKHFEIPKISQRSIDSIRYKWSTS